MNIYTQVCGLVIIAVLIFFYKKQPTIGLSSERKFRTTLYIILACVLLDIASCYFIVNSKRFNEWLVLGVCKTYLLSLHCVAFAALSYTISDLFEFWGTIHEKYVAMIYQVFCVIGLMITVYMPLYYYYDGRTLYSFGPAAYATYFFVAIYITSILVSTVIFKKHIKPKKTAALMIWMFIWTLAAVIQFLNPKLLIVSFASSIGALIMFFEMENPQSSLSRRTGHFSSAVIRDYFDYLYQTRQPFSLMMISFKTVADSADENKLLRKTIHMLSEFLFTIDTAKVFDTAEGYFLLVFENTDFVESTKFKISTYFQSVENEPDINNSLLLLKPYYTIVPNSSIAENADELLHLLSDFIPSDHNQLVGSEIVVNDEVMDNIRYHRQIEKLVADAMENNRIEVHYQPIYDIHTDTFSTAEALVRIKLRDDTFLQPDEFIPIVELSGRIIPLSDTIYRKTLSFIKSYHIERIGVNYVELNLSVKQGESPVFTNKFLELLDEYQINPKMINLEITETSSLRSRDSLYRNMKKLEEHGLSFSLDDFGSGSSNLNYIVDMPVEVVKLDKYLSKEYFNNPKAQAIVTAVIEMAHKMGIKIIAEGIETEQEFRTMRELGVDYIQGFYFSRPLPEHEFLKFMQTHNLK